MGTELRFDGYPVATAYAAVHTPQRLTPIV
jgi:hypothetical protein